MTITKLHAPFVGVLTLPNRQPFGTVAPVSLDTGETVARIQWHRWSGRARFDLLAATDDGVVASGGRESFWGRRYGLADRGGQPLLGIRFGIWGVGKAAVTLPDGRELIGHGNWTARRFTIEDSAGAPVGRLVTTSGALSLRGQSFEMELLAPVLSIVQAAGLAQCIRAAVEESNSSGAAGTAAVG